MNSDPFSLYPDAIEADNIRRDRVTVQEAFEARRNGCDFNVYLYHPYRAADGLSAWQKISRFENEFNTNDEQWFTLFSEDGAEMKHVFGSFPIYTGSEQDLYKMRGL